MSCILYHIYPKNDREPHKALGGYCPMNCILYHIYPKNDREPRVQASHSRRLELRR